MLDSRLNHAAAEAVRVAHSFERAPIRRRSSWAPTRRSWRALGAVAATIVIIAVGWLTKDMIQPATPPITAEADVVISGDPLVIQAATAELPTFGIPQGAVAIPLESISEFLPSDASAVGSFLTSVDTTIAIGQIAEGTHRVFLVTGTEGPAVSDAGTSATCIIDTAGKVGSCLRGELGDQTLEFGPGGGGGSTDEGLDWTVLRGAVPEATSVVTVTTPHGTFWQVPRGGIAFLDLDVSPNDVLEWQFLNSDGTVLGTGATTIHP